MFKQFRKNVHSQNGEDGVLEQIFKGLGIQDGPQSWCVEFGAWDGVYLSNTYNLVKKGWSSVMIEGDPQKYQDLLNTAKKHSNMYTIEAFVSKHNTEENALDKLLAKTPIPSDVDFLSVDIDSYDSDVWETLENYSAKVVCIEINSSIPIGVFWRHDDPHPGKIYGDQKDTGTTFSETLKIAQAKKYTLVCHTGNGIFVRDDIVHKLNMPQHLLQNPNALFWGP